MHLYSAYFTRYPTMIENPTLNDLMPHERQPDPSDPQGSLFSLDGPAWELDVHEQVTVASVVFNVNGVPAFTDTTIPYVFDFPIQIGTPSLVMEAVATDNLGATTTATRSFSLGLSAPRAVVPSVLAPAKAPAAMAECWRNGRRED